MFMQKIVRLIDKFTFSLEGAMQENQRAPFVYELISKGGKDQDAMTKYS
jgi:hypothetical protein